MTTIQKFEDLLMFQKARELTKGVYQALRDCKDMGYRDQIQRASVSIVSNIAEGFESGSKDLFLHYLYIAKGSAGEVRAQLYVGMDVGYIHIETFKYLKGEVEACSKLISSFIVKVKQNDLGGLRRKIEPKEDLVQKIISEAGYVVLPNGQVEPKLKP